MYVAEHFPYMAPFKPDSNLLSYAKLFITAFSLLTSSHYVALASLELDMYTRLALNSRISSCFCLLSAWIEGVCLHTWPVSPIYK